MQIKLKSSLPLDPTPQQILSVILESRGIFDQSNQQSFLHPVKPTLPDLLQNTSLNMEELTKAKSIITQAIQDGHDICVFGDYDADGITATAIMWQTLMGLAKGAKARVMPFIPDRARHGYGLSLKAVKDIVEGIAFANSAYPDFNPQLIITVDNGIVANEAVSQLKELGIVVIITDHHQQSTTLPPCDALIHSIETSGAGISWITSLFLSEREEQVYGFIELATIGIVADQLPLTGINREIVVEGLKRLSSTTNPGILAMLKRAGISGRALGTYDINYVLGPRINAVGRLDDPKDALRLLCSRDPAQIEKLADKVEGHNLKRQELTDHAIQNALAHPVEHSIIVESSPDYHEGIIGLIAGKLVETHTRPAIVISMGTQVSKGSARSVAGVNITDLMRIHQDLLLNVGGHELAGGFSIETSQIPAFTKAIQQYGDQNLDPSTLEKSLEVEAELTLASITIYLAKSILSLEPFGMGNFKPRFVVRDLTVLEDRIIGKNGNHRKLVVEQNGVTRDVIWFNGQARHPIHHIKEMVCTIELNEWRSRVTVQLSAQYVDPS